MATASFYSIRNDAYVHLEMDMSMGMDMELEIYIDHVAIVHKDNKN